MYDCIKDFEQINGRMMRVELNAEGNPVVIYNIYAPHSERPESEKEQFYDQLEKRLQKESEEKRYTSSVIGTLEHMQEEKEKKIFSAHIPTGKVLSISSTKRANERMSTTTAQDLWNFAKPTNWLS